MYTPRAGKGGRSSEQSEAGGDSVSRQESRPLTVVRAMSGVTGQMQRVQTGSGVSIDMISIDHPNILKAIVSRSDPDVRQDADLVVKVSDAFMAALSDRPNEPHMVVDPQSGQGYLIARDTDLVAYRMEDLVMIGHVGFPCFTIRDVWNLILYAAQATGTVGIWFVDRNNEADGLPQPGRTHVLDAVQLPAHATIPDLDKAVRLAHRLGRDGVRVHRDVVEDGHALREAGRTQSAAKAFWCKPWPLCGFVIVPASGQVLCDRCVPGSSRRGGQQL